MATRRSWEVALITNSFDMKTPYPWQSLRDHRNASPWFDLPLAVREGKSVPLVAGTHAGADVSPGFVSTNPEPRSVTGFANTKPDTRTEAAKRSLLMGNRLFLKLTRLARSWLATRGTADDAVLTLAILNT